MSSIISSLKNRFNMSIAVPTSATLSNDYSNTLNTNISDLSTDSVKSSSSTNESNNDLSNQSCEINNNSIDNPDTNLNNNSSNTFNVSKRLKDKSQRKPWYSAFTSFTYKQKNDDFKRLFKELPANERLLVDYACAMQKEILAQGRIYISLNYMCFHANIFGWETNLAIKLKEIKALIKDKTAKFIPNAITVVLENEKYFFTSFASRDKTYTTLYKMWQIALIEKNIGQNEINQLVRSFYGDDLGYDEHDEDFEYYTNYNKTANNSSDNILFNDQSFQSVDNSIDYENSELGTRINGIDGINEIYIPVPNSIGVWLKRNLTTPTKNRPNSSVLLSNRTSLNEASPLDSSIDNSFQQKSMNNNNDDDDKTLKRNTKISHIKNNSLSSVNSSSPEIRKRTLSQPVTHLIRQSTKATLNESDAAFNCTDELNKQNDSLDDYYPVECSCIDHNGKEALNKEFNLSVNYLFECLFGHTEFCKKFWESRKFMNMQIGVWQIQNGMRIRKLNYSVEVKSPMGTSECKNSEEQRILKYLSNKCIIIESTSTSVGVPYADHFEVLNRFCLTRKSKDKTNLRIHSDIRFLKSTNFVIKKFVNTQAMSAMIDAHNFLGDNLLHENEPKPNNIQQISAYQVNNEEISTNDEETIEKNTLNATKKQSKPIRRRTSNSQTLHDDTNRLKTQKSIDSTQFNNQFTSQHQQPQLVPIQTFSFYKWSINVDTLVRLFIVAMICLMFINGVLYYKLRRIEMLADSIRSDPNLMAKLNRQPQQATIASQNFPDELNNWKDMLSKTLNLIEKMGTSMKDWNTQYEFRNNDKNNNIDDL